MDDSWPSMRTTQPLAAVAILKPAKPRKAGKGQRPVKRDPQDEEARIEAAMRLIDAAKQRVQQKRQEYAVFLQQKVRTQREMWRQREVGEEAQRATVEEKLLTLRRERQQQLREERRRYYSPLPRLAPEDPDPPPVKAHHSFRTRRIEAALEQIETLNATQSMMIPADPGDSPTPHKELRRSQRPPEARNPFDVLRDEVTMEDVIRLPFLEKELAALFLTDRQPSPPLLEEKALQWPRNVQLERSAVRARKMEQMLQKARARRQRATALMRADPPADRLLEEAGGAPAPPPARSDNDLMFMTEVDAEPAPLSPLADLAPAEPRRKGRRGRYCHLHPKAGVESPASGGRPAGVGTGSPVNLSTSPSFQTLDHYLKQMGQPPSAVRLPDLGPQRGHVVGNPSGEFVPPP
eukprot:EG_transcript_14148